MAENKPTATEVKNQKVKDVANSLSTFTNNLMGFGGMNTNQLSQLTTFFVNLRYTLLSNYRNVLSQIYVEHGIAQTLVDLPVDDAFRTGFEIKTGQLEADDIEELESFMEEYRVIQHTAQAIKWSRLFGGGGLMIITEQDPETPLDISKLNERSKVEFRAVDMWELMDTRNIIQGSLKIDESATFYEYYGQSVHSSRVIKFVGQEAPSYVRARLRGWGLSILEHMVRSINQYIKNQDTSFSLTDEAKIDIYKIQDFNTALLSDDGTAGITKRIQLANAIKDVNNAIIMDAEDEYEQKQVSFSGLGELLNQIRMSLAADTRFPLTKLFGISASGFNSGEDDIENYNGMVESSVRSKTKPEVTKIVKICCQLKFGFIPDDMKIKYKPLRVLSAEQEEKVKKEQFDRTHKTWVTGGMETTEFKESMNSASLLPVEIDVNAEAELPIEPPEPAGGEKPNPKDKKKKDKRK